MKRYYFTYGTSGQPFYGGWTLIGAPDNRTAVAVFRIYHPDRTPGIINCSWIYSEEEFEQTGMRKTGNFGHGCHEYISITRSTETEMED